MFVQVKVQGLVFDPYQSAYIVVLRGEENHAVIPIWIGRPEANAIGLALEGVFPPRPITHDLIMNIVDQFNAKVISIVITDLKDSTYFSKIHLAYNDSELTLDARPSDAIALALRANAPIFVDEELSKKQDSQEMGRWLEGLSELGKSET